MHDMFESGLSVASRVHITWQAIGDRTTCMDTHTFSEGRDMEDIFTVCKGGDAVVVSLNPMVK